MYGSNCRGAEKDGVSILHGNRGVYHDDKQPAFKVVYDAIRDVSAHWLSICTNDFFFGGRRCEYSLLLLCMKQSGSLGKCGVYFSWYLYGDKPLTGEAGHNLWSTLGPTTSVWASSSLSCVTLPLVFPQFPFEDNMFHSLFYPIQTKFLDTVNTLCGRIPQVFLKQIEKTLRKVFEEKVVRHVRLHKWAGGRRPKVAVLRGREGSYLQCLWRRFRPDDCLVL